MNLHQDHIAISRFASDSVAAAADPRWYPDTGEPHTVQRMLWCAPGRVFDLGKVENIAAQPGMDFLIDITSYRQKKMAALRAHRTQFRVAWGPQPATSPAADLFSYWSAGTDEQQLRFFWAC
jgi:LmbE family N-acetylglucosaminyl deacetylase